MTKRKRMTRKGTEYAVFGQADPFLAQTQHVLCSVHCAHKLSLNGEVL